ncbi:hypothetical protein GTA51_12640 [Desulfovibrio aerotolerans]|uniref:Uncharacterized protein n=1 Tax=Solidesulfovibrio aerotolerans TaxID=295255 RepID=A0A7C9N1C7_9BACT|nr:hypothetical protein [Solidesulfovibrio aerotolerans]MYL83977.1 hypothetical protein [Solidesulfovibrio aerotolerans]
MSDQKCACPCASYAPMTKIAWVLALLFVVFMFFEALTIRWWVMLPLAVVSLYLFHVQRGQTSGCEKKANCWGFWLVIAALLLRDMCLSGQLVAAYCRLTAAGLPLHG